MEMINETTILFPSRFLLPDVNGMEYIHSVTFSPLPGWAGYYRVNVLELTAFTVRWRMVRRRKI